MYVILKTILHENCFHSPTMLQQQILHVLCCRVVHTSAPTVSTYRRPVLSLFAFNMLDSVSNVSATDIPQHLEAMVELLCDEDSQKDTQDPGTMVGGVRIAQGGWTGWGVTCRLQLFTSYCLSQYCCDMMYKRTPQEGQAGLNQPKRC